MNFPDTPIVGANYTLGDYTWEWNGKGWELISSPFLGRVGIKIIQETIVNLAPFGFNCISIDVT